MSQNGVQPSRERRNEMDLPRPLVLDFECSEPSRRPSPKVVGDFIITVLGLRAVDIIMIGQAGGPKNTVRVVTKHEINVSERFGSSLQFERSYESVTWRCSIRGGSSVSALRFLNVQYFASDQELLEVIRPFAVAKSVVSKEVFVGDTLIDGVWNGHKKVQVEIKSDTAIPDFVQVRDRKIFIQHRNQIRRCFRCKGEGHIGKDCRSEDSNERDLPSSKCESTNEVGSALELEDGELNQRTEPRIISLRTNGGPPKKNDALMNISSEHGDVTEINSEPEVSGEKEDLLGPSPTLNIPLSENQMANNSQTKIPSKTESKKTKVSASKQHRMVTRGKSPLSVRNDPSRVVSEKVIVHCDHPSRVSDPDRKSVV